MIWPTLARRETATSARVRDPASLIWRLAVALTLIPGAAASQSPAEPPPGRRVQVGEHLMHIHCAGPRDAGVTVIFEAGGGGFSSHWDGVRQQLGPGIHSCAYDRSGLGWSEPGPAPRTMAQEVFELHALLRASGISGPLVLVGQSIGGLLVRLYTASYPDDVAGTVLVDPTHESDVLFNLRASRWVRLPELAAERPVPEPKLTGPTAGDYDPAQDFQAEEFRKILRDRQADPQPLGERPLIVIGAGQRPAPPGTTEEFWSELRWEKDGQKIDLSRLSTNSKFILDPSSGHNIHFDNPRLVARAVEQVVEAIESGRRLE